MTASHFKQPTLWMTLIVTLFCSQIAGRANDERYVITLRPVAVVSEPLIQLGDIADIDGPSDVVIEALEQLDLEDAPAVGKTIAISKAQVDIRLKLAKAPAGRIVVRGEQTVVGLSRKKISESDRRANSRSEVTRLSDAKTQSTVRQVSALRAAAESVDRPLLDRTPSKKSEYDSSSGRALLTLDACRTNGGKKSANDSSSGRARVVAFAKHAVLNRLPWDPNDIEIDASHVGNRAETLAEDQFQQLSAELKSAWPPLGRVQVVVHAPGDEVGEPGIPVILNVKYFQNTVVAKRPIELGRSIQPEDIYLDRREVRELGMHLQEINDVVGRVAVRPIQPLQPVRLGDVKVPQVIAAPTPAKPIDKTPAVRRGDTMQVVARGGPLEILINAKALQDGQVGDVIRFENSDSKKVVMGKVVGKNQVDAQY